MRPSDLQIIGQELAVKWDDGSESYIGLETLRRACPCAGCKGEVDVLGHLHQGPASTLTAESYQLLRLVPVGSYAVQPMWRDGHGTGLYTFDYLKRVAEGGPGDLGT